jgi:hypothetical protein
VFRAGRALSVPLWRLLKHDWTKFLPSEWFPYVEFFYGDINTKTAFEAAHALHLERNDHHWEYWVTSTDSGTYVTTSMPLDAAKEMVADWAGAGRSTRGVWCYRDWYKENKDRIRLNASTREFVEYCMDRLDVSGIS